MEDQGFVHGECRGGNHHRVDRALELPRFRVMSIFMIHRIEENLKNSTGLEGESQDLGSSLNFMSPITASTSFHPSEHKVHHL